jgi:hypothetical protein
MPPNGNVTKRLSRTPRNPSIGAPPEHFQEVMTGVKEVLEIARTLPGVVDGAREESRNNENAAGVQAGVTPAKTENAVVRKNRQSGGSASRPGRISAKKVCF